MRRLFVRLLGSLFVERLRPADCEGRAQVEMVVVVTRVIVTGGMVDVKVMVDAGSTVVTVVPSLVAVNVTGGTTDVKVEIETENRVMVFVTG